LIYKAKNNITNKCYIGQTINSFHKRRYDHLLNAKNNSQYPFHCAIRKYGKENFTWEVLYECSTNEELNEKERYYILMYNTKVNGYNLTDGGEGNLGWNHSEKAKEKIRSARLGKIVSEETREKMCVAKRGRTLTIEHKKKLSMVAKKKKGESAPFFGKHHTEETKKKMREKLKGRKKEKCFD
jgi:group I intron endonuclease